MRNHFRINASLTAENVRVALASSGLTQTKLASEVGLNQSRISRLLNGQCVRLSPRQIRACELIGATPIPERVDPRTSDTCPEILEALQEVLDGSKQRQVAVLKILRELKKITRHT